MIPTLLTLGQMLDAHARTRPDAPGARDLERSLTVAQWNSRARRLANALLGLGLSKGDRVAVLAYNRLEWAEIYAATAKAGLIAVPINFRLTGAEAAYILNDCQAAALLVEDALLGTFETVPSAVRTPIDRVVVIDGADAGPYRAYEGLLAEGADREPDVSVTPDDPWCLMYTSGTTGNPKGAIRGHRGMAMLALMTEVEFRIGRRDDALLVMPMCHANSLNFFAAFAYRGASITIYSRPSFDPEECLRALRGATFSSLVPTHYSMMLEIPEARRGDTASVEKLLVSSAPAFAETKRRIMEMFPNSGLYELYGSTEAGWVTMLHPEEQFDHLGTVGREVVGAAPIRLLNDVGEDVPDGEPGELFSASPYQFDGYWNLPEKTAEATRGAYLSVGDIAVRDPEGFIRLMDRKKNMIISGGENVYPSEVEQALMAHPDVRDVAVFGMSDPKWGERVVAAVVARDGAAPEAATLIDWTRGRLAGFKRPRDVFFLTAEQMPRNATGKILHRELRGMFDTP
jgi:fatty-acyl-CoA synthase